MSKHFRVRKRFHISPKGSSTAYQHGHSFRSTNSSERSKFESRVTLMRFIDLFHLRISSNGQHPTSTRIILERLALHRESPASSGAPEPLFVYSIN